MLFFGLATEILGIWGRVIYRWKDPLMVYYTSQNCLELQSRNVKENLQSYNNCKSRWSKEPHPILAAVFLGLVFY
jgi:hypothetical protein